AEDGIRDPLVTGVQTCALPICYRDEERVARHFMVAPFNIPRSCTATYFPEANVLVPINSTADRSNTPTSKSVVIRVRPSTHTVRSEERRVGKEGEGRGGRWTIQ